MKNIEQLKTTKRRLRPQAPNLNKCPCIKVFNDTENRRTRFLHELFIKGLTL